MTPESQTLDKLIGIIFHPLGTASTVTEQLWSFTKRTPSTIIGRLIDVMTFIPLRFTICILAAPVFTFLITAAFLTIGIVILPYALYAYILTGENILKQNHEN